MAGINWSAALDFDRAAANVRSEFYGDWYVDPWGWPEIDYVLKAEPKLLVDRLQANGSRLPAIIDVPKENWGSRPAVVLDILDRLAYQALVDRSSLDLIGELPREVYGWRLPPSDPKRGEYSHNNLQWDRYRDHLADASLLGAALRTDLVSCFASMPIDLVQEAIDERLAKGAVKKRLLSLIEGFNTTPTRSGLPQRSLASAVIANMYLSPLDDVLENYGLGIPTLFLIGRRPLRRRSWLRWMDDMWLFGTESSTLRRAQLDLQSVARSIGMHLNSAKTELLEGDAVVEEALQIEHSAVDAELDAGEDQDLLEELIDRLLDAPEIAGRTSLKFATSRMREHGSRHRLKDFPTLAPRMPHAADAMSSLFKKVFKHTSLQDWYLEYATGPWASFEWSVANYMRMFPSDRRPRKALRDFAAERIADSRSSVPMIAVCAQRLARWDEGAARAAIRAVEPATSHPQARRILAISALAAGERRTSVKKWLGQHDDNVPTLRMLESSSYAAPKTHDEFAR